MYPYVEFLVLWPFLTAAAFVFFVENILNYIHLKKVEKWEQEYNQSYYPEQED